MKEIDRHLFLEAPGTKEDIEFWTIKNSLPSKPINSRILHEDEVCLVLETRISLYGVATYHLHIWVGCRASAADVTHAQRLAATMDLLLRRRVTVHLERQHLECDQFLAYFAPFMEYSSEPRRSNCSYRSGPLPRENKLYAIYHRGKNVAEAKQVKCSVSSVNQLDPLVLITATLAVYELPLNWNKRVVARIGSYLQIEEWLRSHDTVDTALDHNHIELGNDATFEDWKNFYKALGWDDPDTFPVIPEGERRDVLTCQANYKLFEILRNRKGDIYYKNMRLPVKKEDLDSRSLFILSNGQHDVNLWVGKKNQDRNKAKMYGLAKIQEFMTHFKLPSCAHMTIIPEGLEPKYFKEQFKNWILD